MEQILAFVLGVGAVAFVWVVVVAFKTSKKLKEIEQSFSGHRKWIQNNDAMVNRRIDQEIDRVDQICSKLDSAIDSRLDKMETRLTRECKQLLKG